jgi:hypothetical protein
MAGHRKVYASQSQLEIGLRLRCDCAAIISQRSRIAVAAHAHRSRNWKLSLNDALCYFRNLSSFVRYNLFRSYCTSFYGCELWLLDNPHIEDICVAWRKGLRRTWNISPRTRTHIRTPSAMQLPSSTRRVLSAIFAVCKQVFVSRFTAHLFRCIAQYYGYQRIFFYRTQRLLYCMSRYDISLHDVFNGTFAKFIYA